MTPPNQCPDLDRLFADAIARLEQAVRNRDAAMHAPVVVTGDGDARIMVLRGVDGDLAGLRFHTDRRSPKVATIIADPRLTLLAYDPVARVQLRIGGTARIETAGPVADAAWAAASPLSRRCYLAEAGPGAVLAASGSALPPEVRDHRPSLAQSEAGRAHFAVIVMRAEQLDWLQLGRDGGTRAQFERIPGGWQGAWIAP
jgi:general stress protein 26